MRARRVKQCVVADGDVPPAAVYLLEAFPPRGRGEPGGKPVRRAELVQVLYGQHPGQLVDVLAVGRRQAV